MNMVASRNGILIAAAMLVACGGGGGGGDSSSSVTPTTVLIDEEPLAVSQEVMASSAFAQSFALGFGLGIDDSAPFSVSAAADDSAAMDEVLASYGSLLTQALVAKSDSSQPPSFAPTVVRACQQGGTVDEVEITSAESAQLELSFTDCEGYGDEGLDFPGILNGRLAIRVTDPSPFGADFRIAIDEFSAVDGDDSLFIDGTFNGTVTFDSGVTYIDIEMATNSFYVLENGRESELIDYRFNTRITDGAIREGFSGGLDGADFDGVVGFETGPRLRFTFSVDTYTAGELLIRAADGAKIRVTANSTDYPAVDIDLDGDGEVDQQPAWSWNDDLLVLLDDF